MAETEGENRHYGKIAAGWSVLTIASIRPLVRANASRTSNTHVLVFFIILVANVGGALTPLGNPTHFAGFLRGADFFWPYKTRGCRPGSWQPYCSLCSRPGRPALSAPNFMVYAIALERGVRMPHFFGYAA